jgi:hypothetical protein
MNTSFERADTSISPQRIKRELLMKKPKIRNPSVKTTKAKLSNYRKKR